MEQKRPQSINTIVFASNHFAWSPPYTISLYSISLHTHTRTRTHTDQRGISAVLYVCLKKMIVSAVKKKFTILYLYTYFFLAIDECI